MLNKLLEQINIGDIENIEIVEDFDYEVKNNKSAFLRCALGGLIGGTIGAILGGASALIPTIKEIKQFYLVITLKSGEEILISDKRKSLLLLKKQLEDEIIKSKL